MNCFHHPSQQAVANCAKCGKPICRNCVEDYGVAVGQYAGKPLCYDCTSGLVASNVAEINKIRAQTAGIWGVLSIFGVFLKELFVVLRNIMRNCSHWFSGHMGNGILAMWGMCVLLPLTPVWTIVRFVKRHQLIKQFDEIIASDSQALQQMRDYFAYTQVMEQNANKGIDLATLASQGSELFDNSYAKTVLSNGEQAARKQLRNSVVRIAENGEIIRSAA
jgi:hypothetical protein